jgi:heme-degrading monooxygenase HmoA
MGEQAQVDRATSFFRERVIPSLRTMPGYLGAGALVNRETGDGASVTYWESAEALGDSEAMGAAGRVEAVKATGAVIIDVDRLEIVLQDRAAPSRDGSFIRTNEFVASPARIDAVVTWMRETAVPRVKAANGYRALIVGANRQTGRMVVSSIWDTAAARQSSESVVSGLRGEMAEAAQARGEVRVSLYEGVVADVSQAAQQAATTATA